MGETKFQKFIFTLMMCFGMVLGMTIYNMILNEGFNSQLFSNLLKDFWLGFFVALLVDIFIVSKIAKTIAFKIVKPTQDTKQIKIILAIFYLYGYKNGIFHVYVWSYCCCWI